MNQPNRQAQLKHIQRNSLIIGVVGLVIAAGGAVMNPAGFFQAYLLGYVFWLQLALGCLGILMIHQLTGGQWGFTIRRYLETAAATIPVMALLFIPILVGIPALYPWANPAVVAESHMLQYKSGWLNVPFFVARSAFYFVIWSALAFFLNRLSLRQDKTADPEINNRLKSLSALGIILFALSATFAAYDWLMSTDPLWYSSMYGVIFMAGGAISAIATAILFTRYMAGKSAALNRQATIYIFNDLGNFLLAFVSFWAYVSFSQFLILWSANLPETITWYIYRTQGGWQVLGLMLLGLGFFLPFLLLLSRRNKRNLTLLLALAVFLLMMRFIDLYWIILPTFYHNGFTFNWISIFTVAGIGGVWGWLLVQNLKGKALLPLHDPRFPSAPNPLSKPQLKEAVAHE